MATVLLDTNFVMTCARQKIDFFHELFVSGFKIVVPKQVLEEMERVADKKNKKLKNRESAELGLKLLSKNKSMFKIINLGKKHVDKLIVSYANEHPRLIVATLDSELKKKLKNKKMVIREKKRIAVI